MENNDLFRAFDISASGLHAERVRMEVITSNIASAGVTRMADGSGPYRRREVIFAQELSRAMMFREKHPVGGVRVSRITSDPSPFPRVRRPGHPDADPEGFVRMPNVNTAFEMVDLITASRAYEANLSTLRAFQEMMRQTLSIGR